jgi:hypothetical protein
MKSPEDMPISLRNIWGYGSSRLEDNVVGHHSSLLEYDTNLSHYRTTPVKDASLGLLPDASDNAMSWTMCVEECKYSTCTFRGQEYILSLVMTLLQLLLYSSSFFFHCIDFRALVHHLSSWVLVVCDVFDTFLAPIQVTCSQRKP